MFILIFDKSLKSIGFIIKFLVLARSMPYGHPLNKFLSANDLQQAANGKFGKG